MSWPAMTLFQRLFVRKICGLILWTSAAVPVGVAVTGGCSSNEKSIGTLPDAAAPDAERGGSPDATNVTLGFQPSNIVVGAAAASKAGDLTLSGECVVNGDPGEISCDSGTVTAGFGYEMIEQTDPDRGRVAVFYVRNLRIEAGARVLVGGDVPLVLVAAGTIRVNGLLTAPIEGNRQTAVAGGFSPRTQVGAGTGPGAGGGPVSVDSVGPGGGGYCGVGGPGGGKSGPGANGGKTYGNERLVPLLGGSSGGTNSFGSGAAGGGALQLVAGTSIDIGTTGVVSAPGGGGATLGGGGAGSGGAILLEAPAVRVAGIVAVNGGGGGAPTLADSGIGENGHDDAVTAKGGAGENAGGDGSSATQANGVTGIYMTSPCCGSPNSGGGGGGGAGRIRINTATGVADITGTLSPTVTTTCVTVGKIGA